MLTTIWGSCKKVYKSRLKTRFLILNGPSFASTIINFVNGKKNFRDYTYNFRHSGIGGSGNQLCKFQWR